MYPCGKVFISIILPYLSFWSKILNSAGAFVPVTNFPFRVGFKAPAVVSHSAVYTGDVSLVTAKKTK